ncbi:MAG: hypothetical protein ACJ78Q_14850 [Chloroflexia bacterium]
MSSISIADATVKKEEHAIGIKGFLYIAFGGLALVLATAILGLITGKPISHGTLEAGAVVTIVSIAAVSIERGFEVVWQVIDTLAGSTWPLSVVSINLKQLAASQESELNRFYTTARAAVDELANANQWSQEKAATVNKELDGLKADIDRFAGLQADNPQARNLADSILKTITYLQGRYSEIKKYTTTGDHAVLALSALVDRFKSNPGRILISIYSGVIVGIIIAVLASLDVFAAVLGDAPTSLGVVLTGVTIGLGSNPAHEIIRAVQEFKNSKKTEA